MENNDNSYKQNIDTSYHQDIVSLSDMDSRKLDAEDKLIENIIPVNETGIYNSGLRLSPGGYLDIEDSEKIEAVGIIISYLEGNEYETNYPKRHHFAYNMREKDFWALVMSDTINYNLNLIATDSGNERDRKIKLMVERYRNGLLVDKQDMNETEVVVIGAQVNNEAMKNEAANNDNGSVAPGSVEQGYDCGMRRIWKEE
jgi:hypothetical protein